MSAGLELPGLFRLQHLRLGPAAAAAAAETAVKRLGQQLFHELVAPTPLPQLSGGPEFFFFLFRHTSAPLLTYV